MKGPMIPDKEAYCRNPSLENGRRRSVLPSLVAHRDRDAAEARADADHYARHRNIGMRVAAIVSAETSERAAAKFRDEYAKLSIRAAENLSSDYRSGTANTTSAAATDFERCM